MEGSDLCFEVVRRAVAGFVYSEAVAWWVSIRTKHRHIVNFIPFSLQSLYAPNIGGFTLLPRKWHTAQGCSTSMCSIGDSRQFGPCETRRIWFCYSAAWRKRSVGNARPCWLSTLYGSWSSNETVVWQRMWRLGGWSHVTCIAIRATALSGVWCTITELHSPGKVDGKMCILVLTSVVLTFHSQLSIVRGTWMEINFCFRQRFSVENVGRKSPSQVIDNTSIGTSLDKSE